MSRKWRKNFGNFGQVFAVKGLTPWPYFRMTHTKICKPCVMSVRGPNNVGRAVQADPTLLCYASAITEQKKCWELLAEEFDRLQTLRNNPLQHPTTCNTVCKGTQHVTSNNVGSWLQLKFVFVFLALKCLKIQTFRDHCPFISGRCHYTERASFYSIGATFESRAGRVCSNKIEVNVYATQL